MPKIAGPTLIGFSNLFDDNEPANVVDKPKASPDLRVFLARLSRKTPPQERLTQVGRHLIEGALRARRGNGVVDRPITKPAEAIDEWLSSLEESTTIGGIQRTNETREAVAAAAEELDRAALYNPSAARLRTAVYADALDALGAEGSKPADSRAFWPWMIVSALGGVLVGLLIGKLIQISTSSHSRPFDMLEEAPEIESEPAPAELPNAEIES